MALACAYSKACGLRTKDVDFDRGAIIVRDGKGGKDRVVMLPQSLRQALQQQLRSWPCAVGGEIAQRRCRG